MWTYLDDSLELATFSPDPEAESWGISCSATYPSSLLKLTPFAEQTSLPGSGTDCYPDSLFGTMSPLLTGILGAGTSTSLRGGSRVKTSAPSGMEQVLKELKAGSGITWTESSVKYDLITSSWKTHLCLWEEDLPWSLVALPGWGMMLGGVVCRLTPLVQSTPESECGFSLWPTPCASNHHGSRTPEALWVAGRNERNSLNDFLRAKGDWLYPPVSVVESLMLWPIGWTASEPLETDKFLTWLRSRGKFWEVSEDLF